MTFQNFASAIGHKIIKKFIFYFLFQNFVNVVNNLVKDDTKTAWTKLEEKVRTIHTVCRRFKKIY